MSRRRRRTEMLAMCSTLALGCGLVAAPAAWASGSSWAGASSSPDWSAAANWGGGAVPKAGQPAGILQFHDLSGCDGAAGAAACYASVDDIAGIEANQLALDDSRPYRIAATGTDQLTLLGTSPGAAAASNIAIAASPGGETPSTTSAQISVPVVIHSGDAQSWDIAADSSGHEQSLVINSISSAAQLDVNLAQGASLVTGGVSGGQLLAVSGGLAQNSSKRSGTLRLSAGSAAANLDSGGTITLTDGANLDIATSGSVAAGAIDFSDTSGGQLTVGTGRAPESVVSAKGGVTLRSVDTLALSLDGACPSRGCAAGTDNSELSASGTVKLGGAALRLAHGSDSKGACEQLVPGQSYTLIRAAALSSSFHGLANGASLTLNNTGACAAAGSTVHTYATIHYSKTAVTVTIGTVPQSTAAPKLSDSSTPGTSVIAGDTLAVSPGSWNYSGSTAAETKLSYSYKWLRCRSSSSCAQIGGQGGASYTTSASDAGDLIYAEVTATDRLGSATAASAKLGPVLTVVAPTESAPPRISGAATLGSTLRVAGSGSWGGRPSPTYSFRWLLCPQDNASSCIAAEPADSASTLTLTAAELGQYVAVQVTASNRGGTTLANSNLVGRVLPGRGAVLAALSRLRHPSASRRAVRTLLRRGRYGTRFDAPSGGSLRIVWRARVTVGSGAHRHRRAIVIANTRGSYAHPGSKRVSIHLTLAGRALLNRRGRRLRVTASERFAPLGGGWSIVTKRFTL